MPELRQYQLDAIQKIRTSLASGARAPLFVLPTGGGKTAVAAEIIRSARAKSRKVLFLAPRRELIYQASQRLEVSSIYHGVIMAGEPGTRMPDVQVASIPTLHARCVQRHKMRLPEADVVLVDEAHIGIGGRAQDILQHYADQGAVILGLTATPARADGRGLGMVYDQLVQGPDVRTLTEGGYLVPARYFGGDKPDLTGVKVQGGDYQQGELGERVDEPKLVGDIVENWCRIAPDRQTFVFAVNVAHSRHLAERFQEIGVAAEHIDGHTDNDERAAIQQRLREGKTQVIVNCQVMTYGVDFPPVSCIVLACPTKSITKYMQMVGRGLRTSEGKSDCIVIDHAGAVDELGFADDPMPWSLDGRETVQERKAAQPSEPKELTCPDCERVFRAGPKCPGCGRDMTAEHKEAVEVFEAELTEIDRQRRKKDNRQWTKADKAQFFGELKKVAQDRGYKRGWAAYKYREKLGAWPNAVDDAPLKEPSKETLAWVKSRQIANAKRREKEAA